MGQISGYTAASAVTDDDVLLGNDGTTTKRFPATVLKTYAQQGVPFDIAQVAASGFAVNDVAVWNGTAFVKAPGLSVVGTATDGYWIQSVGGVPTWAAAAVSIVSLNAQTGTTYTLGLGDTGKLVTLSNGSAITATVPPNSSVAFTIGTVIQLLQLGAGQVTVAQGSGVTIRTPDTLKLNEQYASAQLLKIGTDEWVLAGALATS